MHDIITNKVGYDGLTQFRREGMRKSAGGVRSTLS